MASKTLDKTALLLITFQLVFFTYLVTSSDDSSALLKTSDCGCDESAPPPPPPKGCDDNPPPTPKTPSHKKDGHHKKPGGSKGHAEPPPPATCANAMKLGVCANVLNGLVSAVVGVLPPTDPYCCSLIQGVLDLEGALCLCTAVRLNVLGINLDVSVDLTLLLNYCGCGVPQGFSCS